MKKLKKAQLNSHPAQDIICKRKNSRTSNTVKRTTIRFSLATPRGRACTFES
ncbi:MAG: hypothetical protein VB957_10880 [Pseudomonadales bacterium]